MCGWGDIAEKEEVFRLIADALQAGRAICASTGPVSRAALAGLHLDL
jgi:hypothetical protein